MSCLSSVMAERAVAVILLSSFSSSPFCFPLSLCTFEPFRSQYCGGRKSCQLVNTSHELRLVMCWADAPPPPISMLKCLLWGGHGALRISCQSTLTSGGRGGESNSIASFKEDVVCKVVAGALATFTTSTVDRFVSRSFQVRCSPRRRRKKNRRTTTALGQMIVKQYCRQSRCRLGVLMALRFDGASGHWF